MFRNSLRCFGLFAVLVLGKAEVIGADAEEGLSLLQTNKGKRTTPTAASIARSGLSSVAEAQRPVDRSFVWATAALGGSTPPVLDATGIFNTAMNLLALSGNKTSGPSAPAPVDTGKHDNESTVFMEYQEGSKFAPAPEPFRPPFADHGGDALMTFWHNLGWRQELFFIPPLILVLWHSQSNLFMGIVVIQIFTHMVLLTTTFQCNPAAWCNYCALLFGIAYMSLSTVSLMSSEPEKYFGSIWVSIIVFLMGIYIIMSHSIAIVYWQEYPTSFP